MPLPNRVLVVDDEPKIRSVLVQMLADKGYEVAEADTGEKGLTLAGAFRPDVVLMDQNLPGMSGQEATEGIVERVPGVKVIMITAFGEINLAVEAMRRGAYDYLPKPFDNKELLLRIGRAMETRRLAVEVENLREALGERYSFERILGGSEALRSVLHPARRAAQSDVPVLVEGESGTGKELLVRAIHHTSRRSAGPFVAVNCAAVPDHLVESEFFGHEKGAFTDAKTRHIGRFEQAHGGILFLDEISEMPTGLQAKLLRALEEGEISRVGASAPVRVDARVIAATNHAAAEAVKSGVLRWDLYHRLAVISIRIPPLRERREDITLLARHFLAVFDQEDGNRSRDFSTDALASLEAYDWPGNVRELRNVVQSSAIMAEGEVLRSCDLPPHVGSIVPLTPPRADTLPGAVEQLERKLIAEALVKEGNNRTHAAERLGISRRTLLTKIAQYGL